jgi:hypothetical protein
VAAETGKQLFLDAFALLPVPRPPVALHWWGTWKYEALGLDLPQAAWRDGAELAGVYARFHEEFRSDWLHLHIGTPRWFRGAEIRERAGRPVLAVEPGMRGLKAGDRYFSSATGDDEDIVDFPDYLLGSRVRRPKVDLSSDRSVDAWVERHVHMSAEEITGLGYADHVPPIVAHFGGESLVAVHIPSAVCEIFDPYTGYTGFEQGLIAFHDHPDGMRRLFARSYEAQLEWARAYARAGAHAFVISESFISPDIAHPSIYRSYLAGVHREYFAEIRRMGLVPLCMFWGDVMPILDDLAGIGISGLLVEETKKGFALDIAAIRARLAGRVCLFGNLDSLDLLRHGSPAAVAAEVRRQAEGAGPGFVTANGSPVAPGTPVANVRALLRAGRGFGGGPRAGEAA